MKNKNLHTAVVYWFLAMALILFISGCRSKKSTTDFKQTEIENVSVTDNSTVAKKETVKENTNLSESAKWSDKSFFESWMSFESDKITITDKEGNKTEITNPRVNKKSSQTNDIAKSDVVVAKNEITTTNEEIQKNDVVLESTNESKIDIQQKNSSKGKEPVWLYLSIGFVILIFGYLILKRFKIV